MKAVFYLFFAFFSTTSFRENPPKEEFSILGKWYYFATLDWGSHKRDTYGEIAFLKNGNGFDDDLSCYESTTFRWWVSETLLFQIIDKKFINVKLYGKIKTTLNSDI